MARTTSFGQRPSSFLDDIITWLRLRRVLRAMPATARTVADFGCGFEGRTLRYLYKRGRISFGHGFDFSVTASVDVPAAIQLRQVAPAPASVPLDNASVECVLSLAVLEHVEDPEHYISEIRCVLVPGGTLILTTPTPRAKPILEFLAFRLHLIDETEIADHKHYFTAAELSDLLTRAGFVLDQGSIRTFQLGCNRIVVCHT